MGWFGQMLRDPAAGLLRLQIAPVVMFYRATRHFALAMQDWQPSGYWRSERSG
jgi:hypothetical protein